MIDNLDEALRQLLLRELPIRNGEIDINFEQPKREWAARLGRPTLNLYLYDVRENIKLRQPTPQWISEQLPDQRVRQVRRPVRVDLNYAVTAWANAPEDEHRLLTRTLMVLYRNPFLPEDLAKDLPNQPNPVAIWVAHHESLRTPSDFWSAMDNEIRPAIPCTVTLAINPFEAVVTPMVSGRSLSFFDTNTDQVKRSGREFWKVEGKLLGSPPIVRVTMFLVERDQKIPVERDGSFVIKGVPAGEYTLEVSKSGGKPTQHKLVVPSKDYTFEL